MYSSLIDMATLGAIQNMWARLGLSSCTGVFGLSNPSTGLLTLVRHASKKAGGSSKNRVGRPRGKHRGIKKFDSTRVSQGTILVRQLGLDYHPGLNVGIGRDRTLYAKEPGVVIMTTERVNPNWEHPDIMKFYAELKDREDVPIYKTYFHVIADKQHQNFKLVDQV